MGEPFVRTMSRGQSDVVRELRQAQAGGPPQTIEDVEERLNIIERVLSGMSAEDEYLRAVVEIMLEINDMVSGIAGVGDLPDGLVGQLQAANQRLEDIVQGVVDTTLLPAGLQGTAIQDIPNGQQGIAVFEFSGGSYAAEVTANQGVEKFQDVRVLPQGENMVSPLGTGDTPGGRPIRRALLYQEDVSQGEDILDNPLRPESEGSSFRITISLDTTTALSLRIDPDDDDVDPFNETLNQGGDLEADSRFEFESDVSTDATYNLRCPNSPATVNSLLFMEERIQ